MLAVITAGALAGLLSAPHCALMCGPIGVHASRSSHGLWRYQVGRAASYSLAGLLAGGFGGALITIVWGSPLATLVSWTLSLSLLIAAYRIWPARKREASREASESATHELVPLRAPGKAPLVARVLRLLPRRPEVLGASSVLLPCGALWTGLAIAAASASPLSGTVAMSSFAATSGIGVLASGVIAKALGKLGLGARVLSAALVVGAVLIAMRPLGYVGASSMTDGTADPAAASADSSCPLHKAGLH